MVSKSLPWMLTLTSLADRQQFIDHLPAASTLSVHHIPPHTFADGTAAWQQAGFASILGGADPPVRVRDQAPRAGLDGQEFYRK